MSQLLEQVEARVERLEAIAKKLIDNLIHLQEKVIQLQDVAIKAGEKRLVQSE